ncbi:class IIb bacteriocin, lactobin A/cerein 7B family [Psychroflexus sp. CAK57W]|uniref:class IIb bacteriocin, lactobin A/cerein 7B family n=1 Tax=Psychroflexus curvus TaxID=2873595 RepID=UPI001CCCB925|nr:class IIb bacteriocin, lactobin A/cerein 7B family [Psychroflexus curvus]MBZ9787142.1 class IIb bacteriocin, lactobin A/cerein 7B family [Psychroflexus curvus]
MNLKNLNVTELSAQEVHETEGGIILGGLGFAIAALWFCYETGKVVGRELYDHKH